MTLTENPDLVFFNGADSTRGGATGARWHDRDAIGVGFFMDFPGSPAVLGIKESGGSLTHFDTWNALQRWAVHDRGGGHTISNFGFTVSAPAHKGQAVIPEMNKEDYLIPFQRYITALRTKVGVKGGTGWNARQMMWPCGRLWTKTRVISFWTGRKETPRPLIEKLFRILNLDPSHFMVEFRGEYNIDFHRKGTVAQFLAGQRGPARVSRNLDQELMKVQHVSPPAKKALQPQSQVNKAADVAQQAGFDSVAHLNSMMHQESVEVFTALYE